jgi:hypothetical protein
VIRGALSRTAAVAVVLLGASACTTDDPSVDPTAPVTSGTGEPEPGDSPSPTPTTDAPSPGSLDKPATTSGPLSERSFPTPKQLGTGWRYAVDPGNAEEGYAGNGTPTLARDPREVLQTAVPFGCDRGSAMPLPTHALEVDYTRRGRPVIAVRSKFADATAARTFFTGRTANLSACTGRSGSPAIGPLVTTLTRPAEDALVSDRTPRSDPWSELAVRDRDTVVLMAVRGGALSPAQNRRLVKAFRR